MIGNWFVRDRERRSRHAGGATATSRHYFDNEEERIKKNLKNEHAGHDSGVETRRTCSFEIRILQIIVDNNLRCVWKWAISGVFN